MKRIQLALITVTLSVASTFSFAQVSFTKGEIIKKSYASTTMACSPQLCKSSDGLYILSSGLASDKKIIQMNLDDKMQQSGDEMTLSLPKGKRLIEIFNVNNRVVVALWSGDKQDPFELFEFDSKTVSLGKMVLNIPVDDYPDKSKLTIYMASDDFEDFNGFVIKPTYEFDTYYRKVIATTKQMDKVLWMHNLSSQPPVKDKTKGQLSLDGIYFNDAYTLVVRYSQGYVKEEKRDVTTELFHFDGTEMKSVWNNQITLSKITEEFRSLPFPYISKKNEVEVLQLSCLTNGGALELIKMDVSNSEIDRFELNSNMNSFQNVKLIDVYGFFTPQNGDFENGDFYFIISELLEKAENTVQDVRSRFKHYIISFELGEQGVENDGVIDAGYVNDIWTILDNKIIFYNSLDVAFNGKMYINEQNKIFDRFVQVSKFVTPGTTFHYLLDGEVYSLHSEYATGNMTTQILKWNFE